MFHNLFFCIFIHLTPLVLAQGSQYSSLGHSRLLMWEEEGRWKGRRVVAVGVARVVGALIGPGRGVGRLVQGGRGFRRLVQSGRRGLE